MTSFTTVQAILALPLAHTEGAALAGPRTWGELAAAWTLDPLLLLGLLVSAWVYRRGVRAHRRSLAKAGGGSDCIGGLRRWEVACFWTGWWTLAIATVSPLHAWGSVLFSAHMTQHELLMLVAAPLLVLGRPVVALLFAIPRADARQLAAIVREAPFQAIWRNLTNPLVAWIVHALALWLWHVPRFYEATLRYEWLHHLQHACFFGSALLFWWALIHGRAGLRGFGAATLYLFTTMMHSGLLGALILFADKLIYPGYAATAADWALTPVEDQQLGGLIMWVPAGLIYVVAALALIAGWMRAGDRPLHWPVAGNAAAGRAAALTVWLLFVAGCSDQRFSEAASMTGGDPFAGRHKIQELGCGACHVIPGVSAARGLVGPSLEGIASRNYIGGVLPNEPQNLMRWLLDPQAHSPRTVMPAVVASEDDARDIAAYLYTLRAR
jgi:putative membrane protein